MRRCRHSLRREGPEEQQEEHVGYSQHAFARGRTRRQCVPQADRLYHKRFAALTMVLKQYPYCICAASLHGWKGGQERGTGSGKMGLSYLVHR